MKTSCLTTSVVKTKNFCAKSGPLWALFCLVLLVGCNKSPDAVYLSGPTMGTSYNITLVGITGEGRAGDLQQEIDNILSRINQVASTYIDDSELMQFNRAPVDQFIELSDELYELLEISKNIYELTDGGYDVTVGPVVNLWGFGPGVELTAQRKVPAAEDLSSALSVVGFDNVNLDPDQHSALRVIPVAIDLSSVAKGYAVDKIADYLSAQGVTNYLVEVGGEIRVNGNNPRGEAWRIGIESPAIAPSEPAQAVSISAAGLATSGDYRNYFMDGGVRYSHTIDPRTGSPILHNLASVTVIDASSARADALATGLTVLGESAAMAVCEQHRLACFFIVHNGEGFEQSYSTHFKSYLD